MNRLEPQPTPPESAPSTAAAPGVSVAVPATKARRNAAGQIITGATAGVLAGQLFWQLSFADESAKFIVIGAGLLGAAVYMTRLRGWILAIGCLSIITILVIAFTPLVPKLLQFNDPADPLERCDAIVSLGAGINTDDTLSGGTQDRVLHSYSLLRAGWAPRLVLTGNDSQGDSTIRRQMRALGLDFPVENSGPVSNTHDESVSVARLVQARGWHRVILVTHDWHMHRAAAAFEKAGVHVLRSPCPDSHCDMHNPSRLPDRIRAMACLIHEAIGYRVYRMRGWV